MSILRPKSSGVDLDIHESCRRGRTSVVIDYLDQGGDIEKLTSRTESPILLAAQFGHPELVQLLFDKGADIRRNDCKDHCTLSHVCYGGYVDLFKYLQEKIKVKHPGLIQERHRKLFAAACKGGCIEMIEYLLSQAESPHHVFMTLLASFEDANYDVVKYIVKLHGILHAACELGSQEVVSFLVEQGADPAGITEFGQTPLHSACAGGKQDITKYLLEHTSVEVNAKDFRGLTPMHMACLSGSVGCVTCLLGKDADIHEACDEGITGLDLVCNEGHTELMKYLLDKGLVENIDRALYAACEGGRMDVIELLVSQGADIHSRHDFGETVIFAACQNEHLDVMKYLCETGADLNATTHDGVSLICAAGEVGNREIVDFLLSHGADLRKVTDEKKTAFHAAYDYEHIELARHLFGKWLLDSLKVEFKDSANANCEDAEFDLSDVTVSLEKLLEDGQDIHKLVLCVKKTSASDNDEPITSCSLSIYLSARKGPDETVSDIGCVKAKLPSSYLTQVDDLVTQLNVMSIKIP